MKVKNIAFSGFMASILMAGAAYAAGEVPTLATDQYVIQGVNYAISQAKGYTNGELDKVLESDSYVAKEATKATKDGDGNTISSTYLKSATAATTYETKGTAAGLVGELPTGKANVVAYIEGESAAAETAIKALDDDLKELQETVAGIESYDDAELVGRVSANETAINTIKTSDVMQSGATADKINAIASNTTAIGANASAIADLETGKQANLTPEQLAAVNSGIDADKVGKYNAYNETLTQHTENIQELSSTKQDKITAQAKLSADLVSGLGTMATENADDYTKTAALGALALKNKVAEADIDGTISTSKITTTTDAQFISSTDKAQIGTNKTNIEALQETVNDLGDLAALDTIKDAQVADDAAIAQSKIAGLTADLAAKATKTELTNALKCSSGYCLLATDGTLTPIATISENTDWVITPSVP